jgi:adenosylcobinamide-GDP ribazoletransferase
MKQEFRIFLRALQYFTRIPVPASIGHAADQLGQTARYLPLIGLVVGFFAAAALWLSAHVLPAGLAVGLALAAGVLITGAFHEDGLSDFADGLGGTTRERTLAIMKDSRVGVYGVIALVFVVLLKYEALVSLVARHSAGYAALALIAGHVVSRAVAVSVMATLPYARTDATSKARPVIPPGAREFALRAAAVALPVALLALGLLIAAGAHANSLVAALALMLMVRVYLAWQFAQRLGGYTGDCLGAMQQLTELAFYLGLLAAL